MSLGPVELLEKAWEDEVKESETQAEYEARLRQDGDWCDEHACAVWVCEDDHEIDGVDMLLGCWAGDPASLELFKQVTGRAWGSAPCHALDGRRKPRAGRPTCGMDCRLTADAIGYILRMSKAKGAHSGTRSAQRVFPYGQQRPQPCQV